MPDPADAFLDAAVRSFDDNAELQVIARRELAEALHQAPDRGEPLEALARRFDQVDAKPRRPWQVGLGLAAVISVALAVWTLAGLYSQRDEVLWLRALMDSDFHLLEMPADKIASGLSPQDRLLLMGDPESRPAGDRMKRLWESDPANPAYLAEHARWQVKEEKSLPPELLAEALRLEPDNGYIHYLAAIAEFPGAVKSVDVPRKPGEPRPSPIYEIADEAKWRKTLDHLHAAAMAPRFEGYEDELLSRRLPLLPPADDILSMAPRCHYFFGNNIVNVSGFRLHEVISATAQNCRAKGDREGFLDLVDNWDRLIDRILTEGSLSPMELSVVRLNAGAPLDSFVDAADSMELFDMAGRLDLRKSWLSGMDESPLRTAIANHAAKDRALMQGWLFSRYSFQPETPREEVLQPGRLAEYALMDRVTAIAGWAVLSLAAFVVALYRFRGSALVRRLSGRLALVAGPVDLLRVAVAGAVLPFLLALAVIHFTPLGSRAWSLSAQGGSILTGQFASILLVMLLLPPLVARHFLTRRAGRLGLATGRPVACWSAVVAAGAALPVFGLAQWMTVPEPLMEGSALMAGGDFLSGRSVIELDPERASDQGQVWLWAGAGLLAIALLLGMAGVVRSLFSRRVHLLRRLVLARLVLPPMSRGLDVRHGDAAASRRRAPLVRPRYDHDLLSREPGADTGRGGVGQAGGCANPQGAGRDEVALGSGVL
jgi:hypothetical protein